MHPTHHADEEYVLPTAEALLAGTLALMTGHAQSQDPEQRGCQLSVVVPGATRKLVTDLAERGSVVDWREPNVIRMAPVPMYNSFEDVYRFGEMLSACLLG